MRTCLSLPEGPAALKGFIALSWILVCLLPFTASLLQIQSLRATFFSAAGCDNAQIGESSDEEWSDCDERQPWDWDWVLWDCIQGLLPAHSRAVRTQLFTLFLLLKQLLSHITNPAAKGFLLRFTALHPKSSHVTEFESRSTPHSFPHTPLSRAHVW